MNDENYDKMKDSLYQLEERAKNDAIGEHILGEAPIRTGNLQVGTRYITEGIDAKLIGKEEKNTEKYMTQTGEKKEVVDENYGKTRDILKSVLSEQNSGDAELLPTDFNTILKYFDRGFSY